MFGDVFDDNGKAIRDIQGQQADFGIRSYVETDKTATGTDETDAYPIVTPVTVFGTVAAGTGAILKNRGAGREWKIKNAGANDLLVYPPAGHTIDAEDADVAVVVSAGDLATFIQTGVDTWISGGAAPQA